MQEVLQYFLGIVRPMQLKLCGKERLVRSMFPAVNLLRARLPLSVISLYAYCDFISVFRLRPISVVHTDGAGTRCHYITGSTAFVASG